MTRTGSVLRGATRVAATLLLVVPAATRCEPETPAPANSTEMGGRIEVGVDRRLSVTLRPAGGAGNNLSFELEITARRESFEFHPSLLKFYESKVKPPKPHDTTAEDVSTVLILKGTTSKRTVSVKKPPSGWNGVLMMVLYDHNGTPLATWSDY